MADRIDKTRLGPLEPFEPYEVEAARDALDEEKQKKQNSEDDDAPQNQDAFRQQTLTKPLTQAMSRSTQQETIELALSDIKQAWFHGVDLKMEPSTIFLKIKMQNAAETLLVKTSVSRSLALSFKAQNENKPIKLSKFFKDATLWVQILEVLRESEEEVTRISTLLSQAQTPEKTLSQTFKFNTAGNFWERIGVITPNSSRMNLEVVLAYLIAFIVCLFLFFGILYLST